MPLADPEFLLSTSIWRQSRQLTATVSKSCVIFLRYIFHLEAQNCIWVQAITNTVRDYHSNLYKSTPLRTKFINVVLL